MPMKSWGRPTEPGSLQGKGELDGTLRILAVESVCNRYVARFPADFSQQLSQSENHHKIRHNTRTDGHGEEQ